MKRLSLILFLLFSVSLYADGGNFGLGISLFGPTGITGKYKLDEKKSIEGSLGFGSFGNGRFHLHGVFLYNFHQIQSGLNLYVGGGLALQERLYKEGGRGMGWGNLFRNRDRHETSLGIRAPVGISWFPNSNFELSAELYLQLFLAGRTGADLGIALAGRYYF